MWASTESLGSVRNGFLGLIVGMSGFGDCWIWEGDGEGCTFQGPASAVLKISYRTSRLLILRMYGWCGKVFYCPLISGDDHRAVLLILQTRASRFPIDNFDSLEIVVLILMGLYHRY